ncbi:hypothetical protein QWY84_15470 [Aquisalimonas lutea]|uniref:hypothetical protein n=1 Tax=Aquisalimonas lutea TaxID=1327750 RepID=UPI0025B2D96F|nr:hypothetical protein [Aquisalimonas lutea]MDN3519017.1 hypothetical protein [Aquisalimonas lutea]
MMSASIHTDFAANAWSWQEWLQVAAGLMGVVQISAKPRLPDEVACLTLAPLPMQGPGKLLHKGGWLTSPEREQALAAVRALATTPVKLARAVDGGRPLGDAAQQAAARALAAAESELCAAHLNARWIRNQQWIALDRDQRSRRASWDG